MVFSSFVLCASKKIPKRFANRKFIDTLRIHLRAGAGGTGLPRLGGVGGKGGDIYVVAEDGCTLKDVASKFPAKRVVAKGGGNSNPRNIVGDTGEDVVIEAPIGITVYDEFRRILGGEKIGLNDLVDGRILHSGQELTSINLIFETNFFAYQKELFCYVETCIVLSTGELNNPGDRVLVAKGGAGGNPYTAFTGLQGQTHSIVLDLKLIADVGLVGFPNAGKSSLLNAISRARPRIASYPFTTIEPELGVLHYKDGRRVTMADLPGLIEGAHANVGLGHRFLKHVERTRLLLMIVDVQGFRLGPRYPHRSALETVVLLNKEMELYQPDLLKKPILLAINKMDTQGAEDKLSEMKDKLKNFNDVIEDFPEEFRPTEALEFFDVLSISVKSSCQSVHELKERIRQALEAHAELERDDDDEISLCNKLQWRLTETGTTPV